MGKKTLHGGRLAIPLWRKSLVFRMLATFILTIAPIYYIGTAIYIWGIGSVEDEIIRSKTQQIAVYVANLESDVQRLKVLQSECLMDKEINMLSNSLLIMDNYTRFDTMLRLQQRLWTIQSSTPLVERVVAYIPRLGRSIPSTGSITDLKEEDLTQMRLYDNVTYSQIMLGRDRLFINQGFPTYLNPSYSIVLTLSIPYLTKSLEQFRDFPGSGTALYSTRLGFSVKSPEEDSPPQDHILSVIDARKDAAANGHFVQVAEGRRFTVIYQHSSYLGMTLYHYIPQDRIFESLGRYRFWFWLFTAASIAIIVAFTLSMYNSIQRPIGKLIRAFQRIEEGDMSFTIHHRYEDEIENLYDHFNGMVRKLDLLIRNEYLHEILIQRAKFKQLQSQINPHFLYNSFFILYTMTRRGEYELLERFELQLGNYFQYLTRNAADEVRLATEVEHTRTYCEIQSMRFSKRLRIEFGDIPDTFAERQVPRLILQPIVENAFEHGLESKEIGGLLQVSFHTPSEETLDIVIEDNGESLGEQDLVRIQANLAGMGNPVETTGLVNIHQRIRLMFGNDSGLSVQRSEIGGMKVILHLWFGGKSDA